MEILEKPIVTEKFAALSERNIVVGKKGNKKGRPDTRKHITLSQYAFQVNPAANKIQIKEAVEKMYNVKVEAVNTINCSGKVKSRLTKAGYIVGKGKNYKKAIVTLKDGDKIDFYSNI